MEPKKKLEILIGDDAFKDFSTEMIFNTTYIRELKKELDRYDINVEIETDFCKVIEQALKYDVVVTDLDYTGGGQGKEGYEVIDEINKLNPKPLLILCTSSDMYKEIEKNTEGRIDYHAGTGKGHKFDDLIKILIEHYK